MSPSEASDIRVNCFETIGLGSEMYQGRHYLNHISVSENHCEQ